MKTNFKYVMLMAAALTLGLSSCSNEDDATSTSPEEGAKTYVSIKFASPTTYADQTGTAEESKINTVDVFIYNNAGYLKDYKQLSGFTETTSGSGIWKTDALMETTSGTKQIYLGINLPAAISTSLSVTNQTIAALTTVAQGVSVADISTDNNFVMGSDVANKTFAIWDGVTGSIPAANDLTIQVKRFASKFTVEEKTDLKLTGVDGGNFSDLKFAVGQVNKSMFAVQKIVAGKVEDPNYAAPSIVSDGLIKAPAGYIGVNAAGKAIETLAAQYAPENTNDNTIAGNLTYVSVSAKFVPEKVLAGTTGAWAEAAHGVSGDFWCIKTITGGVTKNIYFKSETEVDEYATEYNIPADKIMKYEGGICYYTVYVNKPENYDVFRNDFYQVTIDTIQGLGDNSEGPKVPTDPVDVTTQIKVTVDIAPWNLVSDNVNLTPQ